MIIAVDWDVKHQTKQTNILNRLGFVFDGHETTGASQAATSSNFTEIDY